MRPIKIQIAKKTLKMLENKSWANISISDILGKKNNNKLTKIDLLININNYFDFLLKSQLKTLEQSSYKDMIFEILMTRLDILNNYRKPTKNLIKHFLSHPQDFIRILPTFLESILMMSSLANLEVNGIKGLVRLKVIFILYILIIYTWNKDETNSLEKTMTTLDNYLLNIDKYSKIFL